MVLAIVPTIVILCAVLIVRVKVASNVLSKAMDYIHSRNLYLISMDRFDAMTDYDDLPSFDAVVFDLTIWTPNDVLNRMHLEEIND